MDRRDFLKTGAGVALAVTLADSARASTEPLAGWLEQRGYSAIPAANLITGEAFNGGVCFDDTIDDFPDAPRRWFVDQDCARVEDIARRDEPGVLAYFHILAFADNAPETQGEVLGQALDYMTGPAGLDPARLTLVMTERGEPYRPIAEKHGVGRILVRDLDEAMQAGDGSGYFRPAGHPAEPAVHSISVHYAPSGAASEPDYPLPGHLELGEFAFGEGDRELFGLGVERLQMAMGEPAGDFLSSRDALIDKLKAEAEHRGVPLPDAYRLFSQV